MCNCGKKRAAAAAVAGGGSPRGCVGPSCGGVVRVVPTPALTAPAPTMRSGGRRGMPAPVVAAPTVALVPVVYEEPVTVDPAIWGPPMWRFLHTAAETSAGASSRKPDWDALLNAMTTGLPCPECREHYSAWLAAHPLVIPSRFVDLRIVTKAWVLGLHNAVNVRRGVPEWTAAQVTAMVGGAAGGKAAAREALRVAGEAGVAAWVIAAGENLIERAVE